MRYPLNVFLPPFTKVLGFFFVEFLDSLGNSYGKEVVSDFVILAWNWSKIAARKHVNFGLFLTITLQVYIRSDRGGSPRRPAVAVGVSDM